MPGHHEVRALLPDSARNVVEMLLEVPEIHRIILFGSRAVGDHEERSDVDIAISAPALDRLTFSRMRDAVGQARTLYSISISLLESMPDALRARVLWQGITLYER